MDFATVMESIENATAADLEALDKQIAEAAGKLAAMKELRRLIAKSLGVEPAKAKGNGSGNGSNGELADRIFDLLTVKGPMLVTDIAAGIGDYDPRHIGSLVSRSDWFEVEGKPGKKTVSIAK